MSYFFKAIWFISSYSPLWLFIGLKYINIDYDNYLDFCSKNILVLFMLLLILVSNYLVYKFLSMVEEKYIKTKQRVTYIYTKNQNKELLVSLDYFMTYIIALLGFNLSDKREIIIFLICILFFIYIFISGALLYINPTFALLKYKVYSADVYDKASDRSMGRKFFITKENFHNFSNEDSYAYALTDNIYIL